LRAACGQVLLKYEEQNHIAFGSEVGDVLGYDGPALGASGCGDLSIIGTGEANFADVDCVVAVFLPQQHGRGRREHLVD
jgi:hypothetical protein